MTLRMPILLLVSGFTLCLPVACNSGVSQVQNVRSAAPPRAPGDAKASDLKRVMPSPKSIEREGEAACSRYLRLEGDLPLTGTWLEAFDKAVKSGLANTDIAVKRAAGESKQILFEAVAVKCVSKHGPSENENVRKDKAPSKTNDSAPPQNYEELIAKSIVWETLRISMFDSDIENHAKTMNVVIDAYLKSLTDAEKKTEVEKAAETAAESLQTTSEPEIKADASLPSTKDECNRETIKTSGKIVWDYKTKVCKKLPE